jgi:hypothetical protein
MLLRFDEFVMSASPLRVNAPVASNLPTNTVSHHQRTHPTSLLQVEPANGNKNARSNAVGQTFGNFKTKM